MMEILTTVLVVCVVFLVVRWIRRNRCLPPGPQGIPGIEGLRIMASGIPTITFRKLREKYGDVFSIQSGTQLFVVLNGYDTIKEALVKRADDFSDRPAHSFTNRTFSKGRGLLSSSGTHWKQTRTFTITALREFGFGKKSLEGRIREEVEVFLDVISDYGGPFDVSYDVHVSISNIICSIVFGRRFDRNDKDFRWLLDQIDLKKSSPTSLVTTFPVLRFLPGDPFGIKSFFKKFQDVLDYFRSSVEKHRHTFDPNSPRDFIDAFIQEKGKHEEDNLVFRDDNLDFTILHLFLAGTETTSTTIRWTILYLLRNPDVQARMFHEIEAVIGLSRMPTVADRPNMPYCDAVITEVLRISNVVPLSIAHGALEDIHFKGFLIPKGTIIIPNLDSVLRDPDIFPNPHEFNPNRFLDKDGKYGGTEKVIAFSLGRRVCLGEALARMELYMFLTSLVQRFELLPDGASPSEEGIFGITYGPKPYTFRAVRRT